MGRDKHEERHRNGTSDPNPLAQLYANPAAAARHYQAVEGFRGKKASWKYFKAQAVARNRIRKVWYHG